MDNELTKNSFEWLDSMGFEICSYEGEWTAVGNDDWIMDAGNWDSLGRACVEINAHLQRLNGTEETEVDSMAIHYMDFYVTGIKGYPAGNMSRWVYELVDRAGKELPNWTEIRMDSDLFSYAFSEQTQISENEIEWIGKERIGDIKFLGQIWGSGLNWQDFGIIRKMEADSMNYKIVGTDGYKPHPSHVERLAAGLVSDATARCKDWKEIRMDKDGVVLAYDISPYAGKRGWCFVDDDGDAFRLTDLSTELEVGLNWQTFGIIRTEEAEADAPERTIADITNERIALLWTAIDELREWIDELGTKTPETPNTTLTPALITALSDWPDSALETIAQAIADGRIVLGGAK